MTRTHMLEVRLIHFYLVQLQIPRSVPMTPLTPSNEPQFGVSQDDWSIISRFALASVGSQGTMGLALALGLVRHFLRWLLFLRIHIKSLLLLI